jgi:hypothetical protein
MSAYWNASMRTALLSTEIKCGWRGTAKMHTVRRVRLPIVNFEVKVFGILNWIRFEGFSSITYIFVWGFGLLLIDFLSITIR